MRAHWPHLLVIALGVFTLGVITPGCLSGPTKITPTPAPSPVAIDVDPATTRPSTPAPVPASSPTLTDILAHAAPVIVTVPAATTGNPVAVTTTAAATLDFLKWFLGSGTVAGGAVAAAHLSRKERYVGQDRRAKPRGDAPPDPTRPPPPAAPAALRAAA